MTTILGDWERKVLVADSQFSDTSTGIKYFEDKVFAIDGGWLGVAGNYVDAELVIDFLNKKSKIKPKLKTNVFVSIDLDVFDPSLVSTGTPEPDGMRFGEVFRILQKLGRNKNLVGLDFTELLPIPYLHSPDYLAAKLIYLTLGSFFAGRER